MIIVLEILWVLLQVLFAYVEALVRLFVPPARKNIAGKVVLITGAGRGIGRQLAIRFAEHGAKVAVWDVMSAEVQETANIITQTGAVAHAFSCDVTDTSAVRSTAEKVRRELGHVDILVNNAGVLSGKDITTLTEKDIRRTVEVNMLAHFWTIKEFLPSMLERNSGHVVTIASMAAKIGSAFLVDYSASKFGVCGLTEALAAEIKARGKTGIRTTTVFPLFVNTALVNDVKDRITVRDRFGQMLSPEVVAKHTVAGVLMEKVFVYIPRTMRAIDVLKAMPVKAQIVLNAFMDARYVETKKTD